MGNPVRAAARALFGSIPPFRFQSLEEALGLVSLAVLLILLAFQQVPERAPATDPGDARLAVAVNGEAP